MEVNTQAFLGAQCDVRDDYQCSPGGSVHCTCSWMDMMGLRLILRLEYDRLVGTRIRGRSS